MDQPAEAIKTFIDLSVPKHHSSCLQRDEVQAIEPATRYGTIDIQRSLDGMLLDAANGIASA